MNENGVAELLYRMPDFYSSTKEEQLLKRNRHMKLVTRHTIPWKISCEDVTEQDYPITREDAFNMFNKNW